MLTWKGIWRERKVCPFEWWNKTVQKKLLVFFLNFRKQKVTKMRQITKKSIVGRQIEIIYCEIVVVTNTMQKWELKYIYIHQINKEPIEF